MPASPSDVPQPAQPPELPARLSVYPYQIIGFALLFIIPILALFGVFGETTAVVESASGGIAIRVQYPNRVLLQGHGTTHIEVRNTTTAAMTIEVSIDSAFLHNYADIAFTPAAAVMTDAAWVVTLADVPPGETRVIVLESRGKVAGMHRGTVTARAADQSASVTIEALILP